ncbi:MAG TPA: pitrilysin family protein [Cyclobacteriaceae bacterium]|nr:pitrilysin family protein [Cyclobacteriaceae bacterium]
MKKLNILYSLLLISAVAVAQAPAPDRSAPPALGKAKNLQLPAIQKFKLSNGLSVVLMEKHSVPLVQVNLLVQTGSFDDAAGKEGLASITMDLLDEGAGEYSALQLADEIEFLGAQIGTFSRAFSSEVDCAAPVSKLDNALKLMSTIVLKPAFAEAELERVRKLRLNGLLTAYDEPTTIATRAYNRLLFDPSTPYGKFANEQSIRSYTKDDLHAFHKRNFVTGNCTLIIVGDVTKDSVTPLLEKYFAGLPAGTVTNAAKPAPQAVKGRTIYLVDKPGAAQSVIRIGRIGTSRGDATYNDIVIMNTILGGSFASRLNTNLREEHGYSYGANSGFSFWGPVAGPFTAASSVQTDVTGPALGEFFVEFKKMLQPIPESDLNRGKNYNALGYAGDFETNGQIAGALAELVIFQLPDNYFNTYVDKALAVNKKGVEAAAKKYITPDNMLVVVVGDRAKVEEGIKKLNLGKINVLSIEDVLGKKPQL